MTAPVASGWSVRRVGLAPTGKRRLLTAHANSGRSPSLWRKLGLSQDFADRTRDSSDVSVHLVEGRCVPGGRETGVDFCAVCQNEINSLVVAVLISSCAPISSGIESGNGDHGATRHDHFVPPRAGGRKERHPEAKSQS